MTCWTFVVVKTHDVETFAALIPGRKAHVFFDVYVGCSDYPMVLSLQECSELMCGLRVVNVSERVTMDDRASVTIWHNLTDDQPWNDISFRFIAK